MTFDPGLLQSPLGMRWTTLALAVAILLVVGALGRRPDLAVVALMAWVGGFEVVYRVAGHRALARVVGLECVDVGRGRPGRLGPARSRDRHPPAHPLPQEANESAR
jgi:hypothetical protein